MSSIVQDSLVKEAVDKGYISVDANGDIILEENGKFYAIEHKLV